MGAEPLASRRGVALRGVILASVLASLAAMLTACTDSVSLGPGVFAPDPPRQSLIPLRTFERDGFVLRQRATFDVTGKLLSKRRYRWDELARVATWDYALGWGLMSDETTLAGVATTQGDRFLFLRRFDSPVAVSELERHSANLHLISDQPELQDALAKVPEGASVRLTGVLVDVQFPDGRLITTSLTREDRGAGACEILLLDSVTVIQSGRNKGENSS